MAFEELTENPEETTTGVTIIGLLLAQGMNAIESGILGRLLIYFGEIFTTVSVLLAYQEAIESIKSKKIEAAKESETGGNKATAKNDMDSIIAMISELRQQNQYLQKQIWELQKKNTL